MQILSRFPTTIVFISILLAGFAGCKKPSEDGSLGPSDQRGGGEARNEITTDCGIVFNGELLNPVNTGDGEAVRVREIIGSNLVSIESSAPQSSGRILLKLHGIGSAPADRAQAAMSMIREASGGDLTFFKATPDCDVTLQGGGQGVIGQLVSRSGESVSEKLVKAGLVEVDQADACGGEKIAQCLNALKGSEVKSMGEMEMFLWKPNSEKDGNLVIHEVHCNADAYVNGQKLQYTGSGNGRCGTYRASRPGCAFGSNIKVEVIDKSSGRPYSRNGQPFVTIPNGCQRVEF